ncbi:hypothetical protein PGH12_13045 [Chryseobacterium wangxinyae]|uniref:hypothetical protein n=1 Tax=Chryseobacterium sp. CY350 TaxID=2997336 RepID=UPI00226DC81F|nr:hypothetical protein [Chryseobacterium sp. CY350]MCY0976004.1 hypothetical protein [Chryseobacterium sp. CY350]WBZ94394.1 hypothetical protein PGH12_13045 [Chryseobacterium sp. CY350]
MKSLYIIPFLLLSVAFYAQEKKTPELQDQEQVLRDAKAFEQKMQKPNNAYSVKKEKPNVLASEENLKISEQSVKTENQSIDKGKLLPNTANLDEVLASIPNRKNSRKANISPNNTKIQGLPNTATLEEIKKTIPKD